MTTAFVSYQEEFEEYRDDSFRDIEAMKKCTDPVELKELQQRVENAMIEAERYLGLLESESKGGSSKQRRQMQQDLRQLKDDFSDFKEDFEKAQLFSERQVQKHQQMARKKRQQRQQERRQQREQRQDFEPRDERSGDEHNPREHRDRRERRGRDRRERVDSYEEDHAGEPAGKSSASDRRNKTNEHISRARRQMAETEQIGLEIDNNLALQREQIERAKENVVQTRDLTQRAKDHLRRLSRKALTNAIILGIVIALLSVISIWQLAVFDILSSLQERTIQQATAKKYDQLIQGIIF